MIIDKSVWECLTVGIQDKLSEYPYVNEIRIRQDCPLCVTVGNKNYVTNYFTQKDEIEYCITRFCKNSIHTYFDNIKQGYIPFDNGYRIGVCGNAILDKGNIINISQIKSINIRVPQNKLDIPAGLISNIAFDKGLLVYSPPNYGKTSLLKIIICTLSRPPYNKRISVIDCKNELFSADLHKGLPIDFYSGYPKDEAIDMAVRNMSPEIIVCDEIGLEDDISPLINCKNSGVGLICSAHAKTPNELFSRKNIKTLHELNIFGGYTGIFFKDGKRVYDYKKREDILC